MIAVENKTKVVTQGEEQILTDGQLKNNTSNELEK